MAQNKQAAQNRRVLSATEIAAAILRDPVRLSHLLGFDKLTALHGDWIRSFLTSKEDQTLLAHRGSYKTTCLSIAIALWLVLRPNHNVIFMRKTDDDVVEILNQVKKMLLSDVFEELTRRLYGKPIRIIKSNSTEITTNLTTAARGSVQLLGIGIKASLTGKHADLVITDDIVNLRDRISRAEREYTRQVYQELQNIKNRGGRLVNTGTPWHKEDAISIMPNVRRFDCYSTGLMSTEEIAETREKMSPSLFAANYELQHIASEGALFTTPPRFTSDASVLFDGIAHIDAAYGGEDRNALTLAKKTGDTIYILGKCRAGHIDKHLQELLAVKDTYRCGSVLVETNADKGYLTKEIRRLDHKAIPYHESMNKYMKISTHLVKWWKNIVFVEGTDPDYIAEIMNYTEDAGHDDCPDSAACVVRVIGKEARKSLLD